MHWYKFNIADYRKDTGHLTMLEHGIYRTLLDWAYLDERPIPKETQSVMRRLGLEPEAQKSLENVLSDFFVLRDDGYHQPRCSMEISVYKDNAIKNIANGKLGGRPKKTHPVILGNPNESDPKGNQEPVTNNHKPRTKEIHAPEGVSISTWESFVAQRKASRAVITQGVIDSIGKEASKAGWTLDAALAECAARGWRGFKAEWVLKPPATNAGGRNREVMQGLTRGLVGGANNVKLLG